MASANKASNKWNDKKADFSRNIRFGGPLLRSDKRRDLTNDELTSKQVPTATDELRKLSQHELEVKKLLIRRRWKASELQGLQDKLSEMEAVGKLPRKERLYIIGKKLSVHMDGMQSNQHNQTKIRKILFFNDLIIICKTNSWSGKLNLVEKISLKDIRLHDIHDAEEASVLEMEILPQYESDSLKRYIISFSTNSDKMFWISAYKSLIRTAVRVKNIKELSFAEIIVDDDLESPTSHIEENDIHELHLKLERLESGILLRNEQINTVQGEKEILQKKYNQIEQRMEELTKKFNINPNDTIPDQLAEKEAQIQLFEKKIADNIQVLSEQSKIITLKDNEIQNLRLTLDKSNAAMHDQSTELQNTKELLSKAQESFKKNNKKINKKYL